MELLSLREHHARTLLIHYRWDVERLLAVFVEKGKSYLFTEAGVTVVEQLDIDLPLTLSSMIMCDICMEDVLGNKTTRMDCGHCFCNDCKCSDYYFCWFFSFMTSLFLYIQYNVGPYQLTGN